jgi:hypothetical protein
MANPKRRRRVVGVVLACLVLFGVWYHIPLHRTLETEVHDNDGASAVLQMDITLHRFFFRGTVVRGTMALDGVSYVYVPKLWDGPDSFLEGLRDKWSGEIYPSLFVEAERLAGLGTAIYMMEDSLQIYGISFGGFYHSIAYLSLIRRQPDAPSFMYTVGY